MESKELSTEWLNEYFLFLESLNDDCCIFGNEPFNEEWDESGLIRENPRILENQYEIVDKPKGELQYTEIEISEMTPPKYKEFFTHEYCDQWRNGGWTGDDYAGDMYYPLPNKKYMRIAYVCR